MNHTLELTGLREDMARDFLAAIGLLRLLDLKWPTLKPKLSWQIEKGFPIIHLASVLPSDWCGQLISDIQSLEQHPKSPLFHGEIIKTQSEVFRNAIQNAIDFRLSDHPLAFLPELMFAAYGGQTADPKTGDIEPTMLSFANGQSGKSLLRDVRELIWTWDPALMNAALHGDGQGSPGKSFRWSPHEYRPAAHRAHDPGSKVKGDENLDHPALNLLAFFGMSNLPSADTSRGCVNAGFSRLPSDWAFLWPVWNHPLSPCEITALVTASSSRISALPDVSRIWKSRRLVAEKSVYFTPATLA